MSKFAAPYGSWKTPITSELIATGSKTFGQICLDGTDIYWTESRPSEGGRIVVMRSDESGAVSTITPELYNVRTRVHEYGGGAYTVAKGTLYFSNFSDQRVYRQSQGSNPVPLTANDGSRYSDYIIDEVNHRLIAISETMTNDINEPFNSICGIDLLSGQLTTLTSGHDFYSNPRISPDGAKLAWLSWDHPNMPWDETCLWSADINPDGTLQKASIVAGGSQESIYQPEWGSDNKLFFISDKSGWWNLHQSDGSTITNLIPMEAEFGKPQWVFGSSTFGIVDSRTIVASYTQNGIWKILTLNISTGKISNLKSQYPEMGRGGLKVNSENMLILAASPTQSMSLLKYRFDTQDWVTIAVSSDLAISNNFISAAEPITFSDESGGLTHANYYAPANPDYIGLDTELPPLLVKSHGGPTGCASLGLDYYIQYWTSRGFAVVDVNYGGSTGYGKEYRKRLHNNWGITDVRDCSNAALYLVASGLADPAKLCISGSSAGGYTTLAALTFTETFKAGASHYGVSDLEALAKDTHKFESRYLDQLIGPYPDSSNIYKARSPINHTEQLSCPLILFQGLEDKVVPPNQAQLMYQAVLNKGIPAAYLTFEEEQHGFRKTDTIKRVLDSELYFYSKVFHFEPAGQPEPVEIHNLTNL